MSGGETPWPFKHFFSSCCELHVNTYHIMLLLLTVPIWSIMLYTTQMSCPVAIVMYRIYLFIYLFICLFFAYSMCSVLLLTVICYSLLQRLGNSCTRELYQPNTGINQYAQWILVEPQCNVDTSMRPHTYLPHPVFFLTLCTPLIYFFAWRHNSI